MKYFYFFVFSVFLTTLGFSELPSQDEIINSLQSNLNWNDRFSMKVFTRTEISTTRMKGSYRKEEIIVRKNGQKTEWLGNSMLHDKDDNVLDSNSYRRIRIITPEKDYDVTNRSYQDKYYGSFAEYDEKEQTMWAGQDIYGAFLDGKIPGFGDILEGLQKADFKIGEAPDGGVLLETETPQGKFTAWLDPVQNYSILKYTFEITPEHLWYGKPLEQSESLKEILFTVDNVSIQKIGDYYVPIGGRFMQRTLFKDGKEKITHLDVQREDVDLNPDFEELGAFKPNIPNGSILFDRKIRSIPYEWIDGKLVPYIEDIALDSLDQIAAELNVSYIKPTKKEYDNSLSVAEPIQETEPQTETSAESTQQPSSPPVAATRRHQYAWIIGASVVVAIMGGLFVLWRKKK